MESKLNLTFIIPAYNEELHISDTLHSIKQYVPDLFLFEVIVVDHGSSDSTANKAIESGAKVLEKKGGSIASVRNLGASYANGDILVFLDADVLLTREWMRNFPTAAESLKKRVNMITGSWVSVPNEESWIEKYWYKPLQHGKNTHINSGHLIVTRDYFNQLGGFSDNLETGEDYEFSRRVIKSGGIIVDNEDLVVIHKGFPKGISAFIKREYWHGKGDCQSLSTIIRSKVAVLAIIFLLLQALFLINLFMGSLAHAILAAVLSLMIPLFSSVVKYRHASLSFILVNTFLYYFYFFARAFSLAALFSPDTSSKRHR